MKKGIKVLSCIIMSLLLLFVGVPFTINASVSGFDYTNYYELDYIQTDGNCYINTGLNFGDYVMDAKILFPSLPSALSRYIGTNSTSNGYFLILNASNTFGYSYAGSNRTGSITASANTEYIIHTQLYGSSQSMTVDNNSVSSSTSSAVSISYPILLGGNRYGGTLNSSPSLRMYYVYISNSNGYVKRYIPAMRKSDNTIGLYECENGEFITKTGNGSLSYGAIIPSRYTISTDVEPTGAGSVTGGGEYDSGTIVTLTASANTGYTFLRWSDNVYTNPRTVIANSNQSYTAIFQQQSTPVNRYTVTTNVTPAGAGTVTGGGEYDEGTTVTLTATANNGYIFSGWSDGVTTSSRSVTVNSNVSFTAEFSEYIPPTQTYTITTSVSPNNAGSITGGGTYELNDVATLTANANSGYVFASWSDGFTANPRQIQVTSNMNLTALFTVDLSSEIVIGTNLNIIDYDQYQFIQTISGTNNNNRIDLSLTPQNIYENLLYDFEGILNDDYLGSVVMNISYTTQNGTSTSFTRTIFVNGSRFKYSTFIYDRVSNFSVSYNVSNLYKKQSVTSGIYDGTQESIESEQVLTQSNEDLMDTVNQFDNLESGFNSDMNDALEDITLPSLNDMGSSFQSSAVFVKEQFDRVTSNTPYGSLLGFSLALGLSLLLIGKIL